MAEAGSSQPAEDWKDEESSDWLTAEDRHVFILSAAGKPIFSLHGDEQKLSSFIGLVQAIVSFCEDAGDQVRTVKAGPYSFVFLLRNSIYLLSASRTHHAEPHMLLELEYLHAQILFILTSKGLDVLKRKPNYDLRSLLGGTENVMRGLCTTATSDSTLLVEAVGQLKVPPEARANAAQILRNSGLKDMLYAMLVADTKLVCLVEPKNKAHACPPRDLLLLVNFVNNLPSLRTSESWTPLCLPTFNAGGFLYAYIVFIAPSVCMLLVTPKQTPEQFHMCQRAKSQITEALNASGALDTVLAAKRKACEGLPGGDIPELVHYVYKATGLPSAQCLSPDFPASFRDTSRQRLLLVRYQRAHAVLHSVASGPRGKDGSDKGDKEGGGSGGKGKDSGNGAAGYHRTFYELDSEALIVAQAGPDFELYAVFGPLVDQTVAMHCCTRLVQAIKKDMAALFMVSPLQWA